MDICACERGLVILWQCYWSGLLASKNGRLRVTHTIKSNDKSIKENEEFKDKMKILTLIFRIHKTSRKTYVKYKAENAI